MHGNGKHHQATHTVIARKERLQFVLLVLLHTCQKAQVRALTKEGDSVLIQPPVYYPFFEVIRDNNRKIVESPLLLADGHYEIDFDDLEEKIASQNGVSRQPADGTYRMRGMYAAPDIRHGAERLRQLSDAGGGIAD